MNNNSSKQILLSVIGVAILVVAVVGVSFAFFTYTRTGSTNNVITTNKITFTFTDGDTINLVDQFPMTLSEGLALTGTNKTCTFTVVGNTAIGKSISYKIYAVPGDDTTYTAAGKEKFLDNEIALNIQSPNTSNTTFVSEINDDAYKTVDALTDEEEGSLLGVGTIIGSETEATRSFTVRMWIDAEVVKIAHAYDAATHTYADTDVDGSTGQFSKMFYTMKIKVVAQS